MPNNKLDTIENDPRFALFLQAVYEDAKEHPERLVDLNEIWTSEALQLIENVED